MKIVIDISKHIYEHAKEQSEDSNDEWDAMRAIANGTPLLKGHEDMNNEKQIQKDKSNFLIDELSKMPSMVIATAYLYAINYTRYGEDVTEKWITATQQACALEAARNKGYADAIDDYRCEEREQGKCPFYAS
jgi:hypothetical protein